MPTDKAKALVKKNKARAAAKKAASAKKTASNKAKMKQSTRDAMRATHPTGKSGLTKAGEHWFAGNLTRPLTRANKAFTAELKKKVKSPAKKKTVRATRKK